MRALAIVPAVAILAGCTTDAVLAEREAATERLRAEARGLELEVRHLEASNSRLKAAIRENSGARDAASLARALRECGFVMEKRGPGALRLVLSAPPSGPRGELGPVESSRLARAAVLVREWLPDHEITVESPDMARAVAAVRVLNEQAGVPGSRLRASTGPGAWDLVVEVRPTQLEALQQMLAEVSE